MEFDYYHQSPEGTPEFEEWFRFTRNVALEDIELCEKSQANLNVGIYSSGLLNPEKENGVICKSSFVHIKGETECELTMCLQISIIVSSSCATNSLS